MEIGPIVEVHTSALPKNSEPKNDSRKSARILVLFLIGPK